MSDPDKKSEDKYYNTIMVPGSGEDSGGYRDTPIDQTEDGYRDTLLNISGGRRLPQMEEVPEKILQMIRLYEYGSDLFEEKRRNFYRQGKFMEDYEDNAPLPMDFRHYYLTYHDLNIRQLRGYFSWRTKLRRGEYLPVAASFAYLYLYELINGIGTDSPEDAFRKMQDFESGFLDSAVGDPKIRSYLHRWMMDFAVYHNMDPEIAKKYADEWEAGWDRSAAVLKDPDVHTNEEIFSALSFIDAGKIDHSKIIKKLPEKGKELFALVWRAAMNGAEENNIFKSLFGTVRQRVYTPFRNAVFWEERVHPDADYALNPVKTFCCRGGKWTVSGFERIYFGSDRFHSLLREADRIFRRELKTGSYLKEIPEEAWAAPYAKKAWEMYMKAEEEAARPKITIDFSELGKIRSDAAVTRDSLLTEEEKEDGGAGKGRFENEAPGMKVGDGDSLSKKISDIEEEETAAFSPAAAPDNSEEDKASSGMSGRNIVPAEEKRVSAAESAAYEILRLLLHGESADSYMKEHHMIPSVEVDAINEMFFDEVGDSILECDGSKTSIVEDYREDISELVEKSGTDDLS